jgi:hypothetical protein
MSSSLRDVAESTLHTVADFVDDAYHSIELPKLEMPKLDIPGHRRRSTNWPAIVLIGLAILGVGVVLKFLFGSRSAAQPVAQESTAKNAVRDAADTSSQPRAKAS